MEYLLRVKPGQDGYAASCRQVVGAAHPEVRAVIGPVALGRGATEMAAMLAAMAQLRIGTVNEVHRGI